MKKIILFFMCIVLSHNFYGQQERDFEYFDNWIDSLTLTLSVDTLAANISGVSFSNSILNTQEKEELIDKIRRLFEQEEYVNLYRLGHQILSNMWFIRSNETKQMVMELYLQYYFYPGELRMISSYGYDKERNNYFTKKSKQRLIELLENKKTEQEYNAWLNFEKSLRNNILTSEYFTEKLIKERKIQDDTLIQQIRDSIYTEFVRAKAKKTLESLQIEPDLIRMITLLDMKESISILKQNLQSCIENGCQPIIIKAYRYALARFGDKEQRQYILDNLMDVGSGSLNRDYTYFDRRDFYYFQDDEMIWKYIEVNYPLEKMIGILSTVSIPASLKTMNDIYPYIKNLPEELIQPSSSRDMDEQYKWERSLYEWLMVNKDTVEFDYEGEKKWIW